MSFKLRISFAYKVEEKKFPQSIADISNVQRNDFFRDVSRLHNLI